MHNCKCPKTNCKAFCPNCHHHAKNKLGKSASLKSSSFFDIDQSQKEYASSCTNSQASQNISTQTTFKSTTSVNLKENNKRVDIYRESCTQTSKTVITLTEIESPRYSPDSLSPKHDFANIDEAGDNIYRELDNEEYFPYERKSNLHHYINQCTSNSQEFLTGGSLTKTYLSKNRDKLSPSQVWISNYDHNLTTNCFKSQSFIECPSKLISNKGDRVPATRFKVKKVKEKIFEIAVDEANHERTKRSQSFMSPTISSESKDQSLEIESIQKLISPTRKGRSSSPRNILMPDTNDSEQRKNVPYIDSSNANIRIPENRICVDEGLMLNLKQSSEEITSTLETGTSTASTEYALSQAIGKLRDKDWNTSLRGLAEIVEILKILDGEMVFPHMTIINQRLIELIKSPRSHVCRTACQAVGHLFEYVKDTRRPEFDILVDTLLCKTADSNKFIRHDANLALDCMVTHIPTFHAIRTICTKGPEHKNSLVRTAAARLLVCAIVIAGPQNILHPHNNEYTRRRIILNMVKFMDDKCLEIRRYGERIYRLLYKDRIFEIYLRRYLENDVIKKIKLCFKHINGQKI